MQSAMFLASAQKRGLHPSEKILKFNVLGGWIPLFRALAKNMAASYFGKLPAEVRPLYVL
jgi:hypothetical protein